MRRAMPGWLTPQFGRGAARIRFPHTTPCSMVHRPKQTDVNSTAMEAVKCHRPPASLSIKPTTPEVCNFQYNFLLLLLLFTHHLTQNTINYARFQDCRRCGLCRRL